MLIERYAIAEEIPSAPSTRDESAGLVHRIAAGERSALAQLYAKHGPGLLRYLSQLTSDHELAEEILQDSLLAIWRGAAAFEGRSSARTWFFGIARRRARDTLRKRARSLDSLSRDSLQDAEPPSLDPDPAEAALDRVELAELATAIQRLAPIHREVLVLAFAEGFTGPEIAAVLDVPEGTVKSRLSNARAGLRSLLRTGEET